MKSFIFALISTIIVSLIFISFVLIMLLFEYQKINDLIKNENWEKTQEIKQLEKLLKECKN